MSLESNDAKRFLFSSESLPEDAFHVVRFAGTEGLNVLYRFEITLASQSTDISIENLLVSPASLTLLRDDGNHAHFHGYPTHFTQNTHYNGWTFYTLVLQPRFWKLTQLVQNRIYLNKNVKELVEDALSSAVDGIEHRFKLQGTYSPQEFSMQYNESLYDYIAWKLERDGLYYYFDQQSQGESIVFTDSLHTHTTLKDSPVLMYSPTSGLENAHKDEVISSFALHQTQVPKNVVVRDYDWKRPSTPVEGKAVVSPKGFGDVYFFGGGFSTEAEGTRLATIRAEGFRARGRSFSGVSAVPTLRPGYLFALEHHFDKAMNREYMITSVTHEGSQEGYLASTVGVTLEHPTDTLYYRNQFQCIESDVQFRPEHVTQRRRISGVLNAFIDSSNASGRPEINENGCYKVVFPQDTSGRTDGKASCWVRRAQPHVGVGHGTSFPLEPGIEVLIQFMDGDPDRPVIAGALSNPESGFMDSAASANTSGFTSEGGGGIVFNNQDVKQSLNINSGSNRSNMLMSTGSMDTFSSTTDFSTSLASAITTEVTGLAKMGLSPFESSTSVGATDGWKYMYGALQNVSAISTSLSKVTNSDTATYSALTGTSAAIKGLIPAIKLIRAIKKRKRLGVVYSTDITSTEKESNLVQQAKPDAATIKFVTALFAVGLTSQLAAIHQEAKQTKEKLEKEGTQIQTQIDAKDAAKASANEKKLKDTQRQIDNLTKLTTPTQEESKTLEQLKKNKIDLDSKISNENKIKAAQEKIEAIRIETLEKARNRSEEEEKEYTELKKQQAAKEAYQKLIDQKATNALLAKKMPILTPLTTKMPELLAEFLALITTYVKTSNPLALAPKKFGGIRLSAEDNNVSIGAQTEVRVAANEQLVLQASPASRYYQDGTESEVMQSQYETFFTREENKTPKIILHSTHLRTFTLRDNIEYANRKKEIHALEGIKLSTEAKRFTSIHQKMENIDNEIANKLPAVPTEIDLNAVESSVNNASTHVAVASKIVARNNKSYSTIDMHDNIFNLYNKGKTLSIKQESDSASGELSIYKISNDNNVKSNLVFTEKEANFTYDDHNKKSALTFKSNQINLDIETKTSVLLTPEKIEIKANKKDVFSSTNKTTIISGDNITLEGKRDILIKGQTLKFQKNNFTSASITIDAGAIALG